MQQQGMALDHNDAFVGLVCGARMGYTDILVSLPLVRKTFTKRSNQVCV